MGMTINKSCFFLFLFFLLMMFPIVSHADLNDGLVAHYHFDGDANDASGNGNNGAPSANVGFVEGIAGQAAKFGGCDNPGHIHVPNSESLMFNKQISLSYFVRIDSCTGMDGWGDCYHNVGSMTVVAKDHDRNGFVNKVSANTNGTFWAFWGNNLFNSPKFSISATISDPPYALGDWVHVVFVIDDTHAYQYVNTHLLSTAEIVTDFTNSNKQDLYIGKYSDYWYPLNGAVDELRFYNRALSASEVQSLFQQNNPSFNPEENLIAYYPLNNGLGNDESPDGGYDAVSINGTTLAPDRFGDENSAFYFDGVDDGIELPDFRNHADYTQCVWIKWGGGKLYETILSTEDGLLGLNCDENGFYYLSWDNRVGSPDSYKTNLTVGGLIQNEWMHVAVTAQGTKSLNLYINGQLSATAMTNKTAEDTKAGDHIGCLNNEKFYFHGCIDDVRIYDKALSQSNIRELYYHSMPYQPKAENLIFSEITNQVKNLPFEVTITAIGADGNLFGNFNSKLKLTSNYGNIVFTESDEGVIFKNGVWRGKIYITKAFENVELQVFGIPTGKSAKFNVSDENGSYPLCRIQGTVRDKFTNAIINDARVLLYKSGSTDVYREIATSHDGKFGFNELPAGSYKVKASDLEPAQKNIGAGDPNYGRVGEVLDCNIQNGMLSKIDLSMYSNVTEKKPLIILPGILGSSIIKDQDAILSTYTYDISNIYPKLSKRPYTPQNVLYMLDPTVYLDIIKYRPLKVKEFIEIFKDDYIVHEAPYDWRQDIDSIWPKYLKTLIDKVKTHEHQKVDIIAHSMGGLVTRAYIQSDQYDDDIDKFVMIGTPNRGSCNTYPMDEGGDPKLIDDITEPWSNEYLNVYTNTIKYEYESQTLKKFDKNTLHTDVKDIIKQYAPSLNRISPAYNFLKYRDQTTLWPANYSRNNWIITLNSLNSKYRMTGDSKNPYKASDGFYIDTRLFLVNSQPTIFKFYVDQNHDKKGTYPSGLPYVPFWDLTCSDDDCPMEIARKINAGDGTVLADEAARPFLYDSRIIKKGNYDDTQHAAMWTSETIKKEVYQFLTGKELSSLKSSSVTKALSKQNAVSTFFNIDIEGDVQPYLIAPDGSSLGVHPQTGDLEEVLQDAELTLIEALSGIHIDNPQNGTYRLALKGPSDCDFDIAISYLDAGKFINVEKTLRYVYQGGIFTFDIHVDSNAEEPIRINEPVKMPLNVSSREEGGMTLLTWEAPADPNITTYNVYSRTDAKPAFTLLGSTTDTFYNTGQSWNIGQGGIERYYVVTSVNADKVNSFFEFAVTNDNFASADFEADVMHGKADITVNFTDTSKGGITTWEWDFNFDGVIDSNEQNPVHTYQEGGVYTVSLKVTDKYGYDVEIKSNYINVIDCDAYPTGDLNRDGALDIKDVIIMMGLLSGAETATVENTLYCDVIGEEKLNIEDVIYILQKIVGLR